MAARSGGRAGGSSFGAARMSRSSSSSFSSSRSSGGHAFSSRGYSSPGMGVSVFPSIALPLHSTYVPVGPGGVGMAPVYNPVMGVFRTLALIALAGMAVSILARRSEFSSANGELPSKSILPTPICSTTRVLPVSSRDFMLLSAHVKDSALI